MGFGDRFKKVFNMKKDVKSQNEEKDSFEKEFSKKSIEKFQDSIKSFKYLNDLICTGENEVVLDSDIVFDSNIDYDYQNGIKIKDMDISIDCDGHEIDGKSVARIFDIYGGNVTIKNAVLKNIPKKHFSAAKPLLAFQAVAFIISLQKLLLPTEDGKIWLFQIMA